MALGTCGRGPCVQRLQKKLPTPPQHRPRTPKPIPNANPEHSRPPEETRTSAGSRSLIRLMKPLVYGSRRKPRSLLVRLLSSAALCWLLAGSVPASADSCAYASFGRDDRKAAVAVAGDGARCWTTPAPPPPSPPPPPPPADPKPPAPGPKPPAPAPKPKPPSPNPAPPAHTPVPTHPRPPAPPAPAAPAPATPPALPPPAPAPAAHPAPPHPGAIALPAYRKPVRKPPKGRTSMLTLTLLITAPAVFAVAVLRPRSSR
jgi:hypothetical protein